MALYYFSNLPHATRPDGTKVDTKAHFDYLSRQGQYARMKDREEDLVYTSSGNMPAWAKEPGDFWQAAEEGRQKGGRAYREIRLGLQEELSLEDNIALVEAFLQESDIKDSHAYSYAIHDKTAAFDKDHRNIHVHIMFNEKIQEKDRPLGRSEYFQHYYLNKDGVPSAGYKASRYYKSRLGTIEMRKRWEQLVNAKFEERGLDVRVSAESLKTQAEKLRKEGKEAEAELLERVPAPHLGPAYKGKEAIAKIRSFMETMLRQSEHPEETKEEAEQMDQQETLEDQKMLLFATDALLRKITQEIRRQRQELRRQEVQALEAARASYEDDREAEELAMQPLVITVDDVVQQMVQKVQQARAEADTKKQENDRLRSQLIPEARIRAEAIFRVVGPEYRNAKKRRDWLKDRLEPMKKEYVRLRDVPYTDDELQLLVRHS